MSSYDRYSASVFRNTNWSRYATSGPSGARFGAPLNEIERVALGEARYRAETRGEAVSDFVQSHPADAKANILCYARVSAGGGWVIGLYEPSGRVSQWLLKGDREAVLHCDCHCGWNTDCPRVVSRTPQEIAALATTTIAEQPALQPVRRETAHAVPAIPLALDDAHDASGTGEVSESRSVGIFAGWLRSAKTTPTVPAIAATAHPRLEPAPLAEINPSLARVDGTADTPALLASSAKREEIGPAADMEIVGAAQAPAATPLRRVGLWERLRGKSDAVLPSVQPQLAGAANTPSALPDGVHHSDHGTPAIAVQQSHPDVPAMIEDALPGDTTRALPPPDASAFGSPPESPAAPLPFFGFRSPEANPVTVDYSPAMSSQAEIDIFVAALRDTPATTASAAEEPAGASSSSGRLFSRWFGGNS